MGSIRAIFEELVERKPGEKIKIEVVDRNEYETIRTRLSRFWNERKEVITAISPDDSDPMLGLSLCADYEPPDPAQERFHGIATYYLGRTRRKVAKSYSFAILPTVEDDGNKSP